MNTVTLHLDGPISEIPRSDTLFGAICWGIRISEDESELEALLERFASDDPPFRISSAFPVINTGVEPTYLLPRPRIPIQETNEGQVTQKRLDAMKRWQRLDYIPESVFDAVVTGDITGQSLLASLEEESITIDQERYKTTDDGDCLLPADDDEAICQSPFVEQERVRNAVNRLSNSTEGALFHDRSIRMTPGSALYLVVTGELEPVLTGLAAIQDHGIGGGKSVGKGTYTLDWGEQLSLTAPEADDSRCTLSLCIPRDEMLESVLTDGYYDLDTRKGVLESSFTEGDATWKKQVLAVTEGSVLPPHPGPVGYNPIVADKFEHGVQQFGYELPVAVDATVL